LRVSLERLSLPLLLLLIFFYRSAVLSVSVLIDRAYYRAWTFPPAKFLYFNIAQSLAIFYGKNDWHYYLSQGLPLLLTTALPFSLIGLYRALFPPQFPEPTHFNISIKRQLAAVCIFMSTALSLIAHKEVRFIYPLLPALHILTSPSLVDFFHPAISSSSSSQIPRRLLLIFLVLVNIVIALYTTLSHASGVLNVMDYLREQHSTHTSIAPESAHQNVAGTTTTAGFLMPCHSTPWRSHLVLPGIHAWALSCEPPVDLNATEKALYLDEADQFYENPKTFLRENMIGGLKHLPKQPSYLDKTARPSSSSSSLAKPPLPNKQTTHPWPDNLIFFSHLESTMQDLLRGSFYSECWRTWNTAWHDDWRRQGDIIIWCLDPNVQSEWAGKIRRQKEAERDMQFDRLVEGIRKSASSGWGWGKPVKRTSWSWKRWVPWGGGKTSSGNPWSPSSWLSFANEQVEKIRRRYKPQRNLWD
jgi:phosphatidylinositol glycan class B